MSAEPWTITAYPRPGFRSNGEPWEQFKVIAVSPDRKRVIHRDRLTAAQVEAFNAELEWAR